MRNCRTSKIDGLIDIYRNDKSGFDPEPTTIPYVLKVKLGLSVGVQEELWSVGRLACCGEQGRRHILLQGLLCSITEVEPRPIPFLDLQNRS